MRLGNIADVDIVADTRPISSRIVVSIDRQAGAQTRGSMQRKRNQVRFRVMYFADLAAFVRSGCIEVSQGYVPEAVGPLICSERTSKNSFETPYGLTGSQGVSSLMGMVLGRP